MMKKGIFVVVFLGIMALTAGNAHAIAITDVDGFFNSEWTSPLLSAVDPNEATIDDRYDIWKIAMIMENNGNANDGLYIGWLLHGNPTFGAYPELGGSRPYYRTILDMNSNGIEDGNDRRIDYMWVLGAPVIAVYDGSLNPVPGAPIAAMQTSGTNAGVEWFIPKSMFASFPMSGFQSVSRLDNGGMPLEDDIPDNGWSTTVPEPGSAMLLGVGLLGFAGMLRRKFMA